MFDHQWLDRRPARAPDAADVWDVEHDGYADAESGHGTFIAGLILQVAPAAEVYVVKVLDSHGVGDDAAVAAAMEQLPQDIDIVNLSLGGYTDDDAAPLAIACALQRDAQAAQRGRRRGRQRGHRRARSGRRRSSRCSAVGAVDEKDAHWHTARLQQLRLVGRRRRARRRTCSRRSRKGKTRKVAQGAKPEPADPTIAFDGWAAWDGTSFASPITAAMIARTMSRNGFASAADAQAHLLATAPPAPQPDFPLAVWWTSSSGLNCSPKWWSRGSRSASPRSEHVQPHDAGAQAVEREAPELVGLHGEPVLARPLDRHGRGAPAGAAGRRGGARAARSATTSSSIPSRGDSKLNCRGPRPPRTS